MEENTSKKRSLPEVERIMGFAKLEKSDLKPTVQSLHFSDSLNCDTDKLIEINAEILQCLENGQCLTVRGAENDSAVLCTSNKTYDMKEQETSNYLLLVPDLKAAKDLPSVEHTNVRDLEIPSMHQKYFELKEIKPRLKVLQLLLRENVFSGMECEDDENHQGNKYNFEDLLDRVQSSEEELRTGIQNLNACYINGYWRLIDFDFKFAILNHIIKLTEEENWDFDKIPTKQCCDTLEQLYPRHVVAHVLKEFSSDVEVDEGNNEICKLSEDGVCKFFAELILKPSDKFNFQEFQKVWQESVPPGLKTGLYQLAGLAIIDHDSSPEVISYFPVEDLSDNVEERFQALFKEKPKWTTDEIMPYIEDLSTAKVKASALLTKFGRASTLNGIKVYNSRKLLS